MPETRAGDKGRDKSEKSSPAAKEMSIVIENTNKKIASLSASISKQLDALTSSMNLKLNTSLDDFKSSLKEVEDRLIKSISERFSSVQSDISTMQQQFVHLESRLEHLERQGKVNDVILSGIPHTADEKLPKLFANLCAALKIDSKLTPSSIFRTSSRVNASQSSIVVKFQNLTDKICLLKAAQNVNKDRRSNGSKSLSLHDVGLARDDDPFCPIFVNESLTLKNYAIKRKALSLLRCKKLAMVFTRSGRVFVRKVGAGANVPVTSIADLDGLVTE